MPWRSRYWASVGCYSNLRMMFARRWCRSALNWYSPPSTRIRWCSVSVHCITLKKRFWHCQQRPVATNPCYYVVCQWTIAVGISHRWLYGMRDAVQVSGRLLRELGMETFLESFLRPPPDGFDMVATMQNLINSAFAKSEPRVTVSLWYETHNQSSEKFIYIQSRVSPSTIREILSSLFTS